MECFLTCECEYESIWFYGMNTGVFSRKGVGKSGGQFEECICGTTHKIILVSGPRLVGEGRVKRHCIKFKTMFSTHP